MSQKHFKSSIVRFLLFLALVWLILILNCKTQKMPARWSKKPIEVDGQQADWDNTSIGYFEDMGVQLGLCNDTERLYVIFRFSDPRWAQAILMGGVTLWLDNSGKKNKDFGIRYSGGPSLSVLQNLGKGGFWDKLTSEQKERLMDKQTSMADQVTVVYKEKDQGIALPADGSSGPAVAFADTQNIYTYEFSIPLKKSSVFSHALGVAPGQTIGIGLEWGGMDKEERQRMMKGMGGGRGVPPGGGGGGRGGRGNRPGGGFRPQTQEKQEVWVKTKLALPPQEQG